jgi:hypothetical protein
MVVSFVAAMTSSVEAVIPDDGRVSLTPSSQIQNYLYRSQGGMISKMGITFDQFGPERREANEALLPLGVKHGDGCIQDGGGAEERLASLKNLAFSLMPAPVSFLTLSFAVESSLRLSVAISWGIDTPGAAVCRVVGANSAAAAS